MNPYEIWQSNIIELINQGRGDDAIALQNMPPPRKLSCESEDAYQNTLQHYNERIARIITGLDNLNDNKELPIGSKG